MRRVVRRMIENICVEGGETDDGEYLCGGWWDG